MNASGSRPSGLDIPFVEMQPVSDEWPLSRGVLPEAELARGTFIADRYRVLSKIAEGGMGVLYACEDTVLSRQVAVKLMRRSLAAEPQVSERLLREARLAAQLRRHVVQIFDCGTLETGEPYIVMELLRGRDLFSVLRSAGPLSPEQVTGYMLEVCVGLTEAHGKGIIHRDLKPENLFCAEEPDGSTVLKIVDFGVSKQLSHARVRAQTNPGESVGSPQYMSPEQITTPGEVDTRTDIWSLGVVMFELLTGKSPFNGAGPAQICAAVLTQTVPPLSQYRDDVPPVLEAIMRRCLERDRELRFPNVAELALSLTRYSTPKDEQAILPPVPVRRGRRRWLGAAFSILVLGGCGALLWAAARGEQVRLPTVSDIQRLPATISAWKVPFLTPAAPAEGAPVEHNGPEGMPNRPLEQRPLAPAAPFASAASVPVGQAQGQVTKAPAPAATLQPAPAERYSHGAVSPSRSFSPAPLNRPPTSAGKPEASAPPPAAEEETSPALAVPQPTKSDSPYGTGESDP